VHCATRAWRHPLRHRGRPAEPEAETYPPERDLWIWDDRSGQAISALRSRDRRRHQPVAGAVAQAAAVLGMGSAVRRHYRALLAGAYGSPVDMAGRVRVALEGAPDTLERELAWLERLGGAVPVHLRLYRHEPPARLDGRLAAMRAVKAAGHPVSAALVQDRGALLDASAWEAFVARACEGLEGAADWVEVGHAINRVKWGLWSPRDYGRLMAPVEALARRFPALAFTGPAGIDFEYPFVTAALRCVPRGLRLAALSHHLYVDRRGAPETPQGRFATLEKLALCRAIGRASGVAADRLIVSEVNWPLLGTGVYSPVGSPYESPGARTNDPSVTERLYAEYMVRYLAIALASGLADEVVWWRLAAHGYGLVDDRAPGGEWREREAFAALGLFMRTVGPGRFVGQLPVEGAAGAHVLRFERGGGGAVLLAWTAGEPRGFAPPRPVTEAFDIAGAPVPAGPEGYPLTGRPLYLRLAAE
jgi:hypothetical protein